MNEMSAAIERLRFAVRTLPSVLAGFSEAESEQRPSSERWTKKEVVGHLIVARGVEQRPVADEEAHVLLFEPASTLNTGNVQNERTVAHLDRI